MSNIRLKLLIAASPGVVYQALTTSEGLSAWWTPGSTAEPSLESSARFPFGPTYYKQMKITDLQPSSGISWHCIAGTEEWVGTNISFNLQEGTHENLLKDHPELSDQLHQVGNTAELTVLSFQHSKWREASPMFAECSYSWGQFLRSLKLYCETGKGKPWPTQHRV